MRIVSLLYLLLPMFVLTTSSGCGNDEVLGSLQDEELEDDWPEEDDWSDEDEDAWEEEDEDGNPDPSAESPEERRLRLGREAYLQFCAGCHGEQGEGDGEAARFLNPPPRDFVKAKYKFRTTRFGKFPTDEDLFRTITRGLEGTAMPSWRFLPEQTRWALVDYLKDLGWERLEFGPAPPIPFVDDPYSSPRDREKAIARGEEVYHGYFSCWHCHPAYVSPDRLRESLQLLSGTSPRSFRDNLHRSAPKETTDGQVNYPPDFLRDLVKSGSSVRDLYRVIGSGITGTAMPTWIDSIKNDVPDPENDLPVGRQDLWAMSYYIESLIEKRPRKIPFDAVEVRNRKILFTPSGAHLAEKIQTSVDDG